eukprot:COSAG01_NODE_331_length_18718_cov_21.881358_4_plen_156_part_00
MYLYSFCCCSRDCGCGQVLLIEVPPGYGPGDVLLVREGVLACVCMGHIIGALASTCRLCRWPWYRWACSHAVDDGWSGFRVHNDALMMRRARHLLATAPQSCCAGGHQLWGGGGGSPGGYHLGAVIATIKIPGFDWNSPTLDLAISAANTIKLLA